MTQGKILFVNQEITPYLHETEMSIMGRFVPQIIQDKFNKEVRVFMPNFGNINERKNQLHEVIRLSGINIVIDNSDHPLLIKVASIPTARLQVYFIDNEDYFHRKFDIKDANGAFFEDNDVRSIFFCRGVLETIKKLSWKPNVIHCAGWFSALLPFYVKRTEYKNNPYFSESKIVISLFGDDFEDAFCENLIKKLKNDGGTAKDWAFYKEATYLNIMKAAIAYADGIVLASEVVNPALVEFAQELKKPIVEYCPMPDIAEKMSTLYDSIMVLDD
jgi:starch synthase